MCPSLLAERGWGESKKRQERKCGGVIPTKLIQLFGIICDDPLGRAIKEK
jgi:hypothetical protein